MIIGGPEKRRIVLVDHDPAWAERFLSERSTVRNALGEKALAVDHIGSTAVPGLMAKPIIDILLSVADVDAESDYLPALQAAGYVLRVRESGHRMLRTPALDVHLHVLTVGDPNGRLYLALRDRLRADPSDRERYERKKRELATQDWPTMDDYADAKSGVIADILSRADVS